ncbi:MAG: glycosyltransferase [Proteobacteria bacterium]|nr:glycosyltransferase [Pseudomonadota bacterium]
MEAFNRLREAPAELKIFGDFVPYHGDQGYSSELRKLGENPRIKFMGGFPPERVGEIFSEIDVLITPSIWMENSPLVIHEASLAQVPVIASRIGGIPELIEDGKNGLLFEPNNALDLQKKIELLLNRPETLSRLRAYPAQIKTIEQNAQELEEIYARLIANRS